MKLRVLFCMITAVLTASILAGQASAQQQEYEQLFSTMPEGTQTPPSLGVRSNYMISSEMAVLNADALLSEDTLNITLHGDTYTVSRESLDVKSTGNYSWTGSGDRVENAIFVVENGEASGLIYTTTKTFEILYVSSNIHEIYELDMSKFPPTASNNDKFELATHRSQEQIGDNRISQLEAAYMGWLEYTREQHVKAEPVTINVMFAITDKGAKDYEGHAGSAGNRAADLAIKLATAAYKDNHLPIQITRVREVDNIQSFYQDTEKFETNLKNLMNRDRYSNPFAGVHLEMERENADLAILIVGDYSNSMGEENEDLYNKCGLAHEFFVTDKDDAFAIVQSPCIAAHAVTNVIGYMQGAGYNPEQKRNTEFAYGHGYYNIDINILKRTIMSANSDNCNHPLTQKEEYCKRITMWSDPHRNFFGTQSPTGTVEHWNSRVVFSTAPHLGSMRGEVQDYDSVRPTGAITLPAVIPTSGTIRIDATFSEPIHEWFPPDLTITDGASIETTGTMTRQSPTSYTYLHTLDGERGDIDLIFSNARDMLGNPIIRTPTSGASFTADAKNARPHPSPPADSITAFDDIFSKNINDDWITTGEANWTDTRPTELVPDEDVDSNRVAASDHCDDSCILTLNKTLDTTEPLSISFDRYVDRKIDNREGLFIEYSVDDGNTWTRLASYTGADEYDTDRWRDRS